MPTGPKGQNRPADVMGNAVRVMRIGTGEEDRLWSMEDLVAKMDEFAPKPGPHKKAAKND